MPRNDFLFGYFFARRFSKQGQPRQRKYPKMPSGAWRIAASICISIGAGVSWLLFRHADSGALAARIIVGALAGLVIGMYIVETIWERRRRRESSGAAASPIGRRR